MMKEHLKRHGISFGTHFKNNWSLTIKALKAACYTFGHGLTPRISGMRASELHNEIWTEGREASLNDLRHRLESGLYKDKEEALEEHRIYSSLYSETPLMTEFKGKVEDHFAKLKVR